MLYPIVADVIRRPIDLDSQEESMQLSSELFSISLQNLGNLFVILLALSLASEVMERLFTSKSELELLFVEASANEDGLS